jgi:hypothetical protein
VKTVSERREEHAGFIAVALEAQANCRDRWRAYVEQIAAKDIPMYVGDKVDVTDYESLRRGIRAEILAAVSGQAGGFVKTSCDDCRTALWDGAPDTILTCIPPKFWADCIGCGRRYALGLECRAGWLPPKVPVAEQTTEGGDNG